MWPLCLDHPTHPQQRMRPTARLLLAIVLSCPCQSSPHTNTTHWSTRLWLVHHKCTMLATATIDKAHQREHGTPSRHAVTLHMLTAVPALDHAAVHPRTTTGLKSYNCTTRSGGTPSQIFSCTEQQSESTLPGSSTLGQHWHCSASHAGLLLHRRYSCRCGSHVTASAVRKPGTCPERPQLQHRPLQGGAPGGVSTHVKQ